MKKSILLTACACAMLTACSEKRPAVVENPVFDVWNSATLEVRKIEMSDTATVLHIGAYFRPISL
ncbi:hypothetical protein AGMMS49965_22740 [Bacteroidia bacterium]|nr:hypothetical protein AGMMS49965_22740 [Bacteroidia bacterium]